MPIDFKFGMLAVKSEAFIFYADLPESSELSLIRAECSVWQKKEIYSDKFNCRKRVIYKAGDFEVSFPQLEGKLLFLQELKMIFLTGEGKRIALKYKDFSSRPEVYDFDECEVKTVDEGAVLYIYKGNILCHLRGHDVIDATAVVYDKSDNSIQLNAEYCLDCKKALIEYSAYEAYRDKYGIIVGNFRIYSDGYYNAVPHLASESPLHLSGYNVGKTDNYSDTERHLILARVLYNKIMTKSEIISYLSRFIRMNGSKPGNEEAVEKWRLDIEFVQHYDINLQPKVYISSIKRYNN